MPINVSRQNTTALESGEAQKTAVDAQEHGAKVAGLFGRIAPWYDFLNHFLSLGFDVAWRRRLVRCIPASRAPLILDLAAGTLDVSREILRRHPTSRVLALDFSYPMLARGQKKIQARAISILPATADGRCLPLPDQSVDCVTMAFGIRNIVPRQAAYGEIMRVLKPGGRFCILEFGAGRQKILRGIYNIYLHRLLPWIGRTFSGDAQAYSYLAETIQSFPEARQLSAELVAAGFFRVYSFPLTGGIVQIHVAENASAHPG